MKNSLSSLKGFRGGEAEEGVFQKQVEQEAAASIHSEQINKQAHSNSRWG